MRKDLNVWTAYSDSFEGFIQTNEHSESVHEQAESSFLFVEYFSFGDSASGVNCKRKILVGIR